MNTVKVRIAVAVSDLGQWAAVGHSDVKGDGEVAVVALEGLEQSHTNEVVHYIEAEVPVPIGQVLEGKVA